MLRLIFVVLIIVTGTVFSLHSAFFGLLFYLWNAYFRPEDWSYGPAILSLRLSLIIGIYVVVRTIASFPSPKINLRTGLIVLFFIQAVVGVFTSEQYFSSASFLENFGKVLVITYLIVVLVDDRAKFRIVLVVIAASLGFEMAKQGWVNLYRAPGAQNNNQILFLGDNNGVALGAMMLLPILGALIQTSRKPWEKNAHRFVAVGVLMRGITTYSRGGFLGAGTLAVMAVIRSEKRVRAIVAICLLGALVFSVMPQEFWARMDTITVEEGGEREESSAGRLHFWRIAVDMAQAKPMTGVGLNAFNVSYLSYNTDERFGGERAAHSIWFGVLGDLGYPGLVLFAANLGMAFWSCWGVVRLTRSRPELRTLRIYANALISTLAVYAVTGSFLSMQYNEMAWHMFGLSTALHLIAVQESRDLASAPAKRQAA